MSKASSCPPKTIDVYIEFNLVTIDDDFDSLERSIAQWAETHNVPYTTKIAKGLRYRLGLNYPEHFTLFFMTWSGNKYEVKNTNQY